jgi:hypothetical protein
VLPYAHPTTSDLALLDELDLLRGGAASILTLGTCYARRYLPSMERSHKDTVATNEDPTGLVSEIAM